MSIILNVVTVIISATAMEAVAWLSHKYLMHGFLWVLHADHHIPHEKKWEYNDFFALIFALPSFLGIFFGIKYGFNFYFYIGIGILIYGLLYTLIHEGLIHGRIKIWQNTQNWYLLGLKLGHQSHHIKDQDPNRNKLKDLCFGMLWVPNYYFEEAKKQIAANAKKR